MIFEPMRCRPTPDAAGTAKRGHRAEGWKAPPGELAGWALALSLFAALWAGCGPPGSPYPSADVRGRVTLDGVPVEKGTINIMPAGAGQARADSAEITGGAYHIDEAPLGKVRAYIIIPKKTGRMLPGTTSPVEEEINATPANYLQGIEAEISGDTDQLNFELVSQRAS